MTQDENQKAYQEDLQKRVESFNGDLIPLLGKYELGLSAIPFITNDGRIAAKPNVFDDRKPKDGGENAEKTAPEDPKVDSGAKESTVTPA